MKIAIPTSDGRLCAHFGHCAEFTLIDVDEAGGSIGQTDRVPAPPHQPGLLPGWLAQQGVQLVIAGGIGQRAIQIFNASGIRVLPGAPELPPEDLIRSYLDKTLVTSGDVCSGGHEHGGDCGGH